MAVIGDSGLQAGSAALSYGLPVVLASKAADALIARNGKYRIVIWSGWLLHTAGVAGMITFAVNTSTMAIVFVVIALGASQGMLSASHSAAIQVSAKSGEADYYASAMYAFCSTLGDCIGIIVGGTIFQNMLRVRLRQHGLDAGIALDLEGYYQRTLRTMVAGTEKDRLLEAYNWAFKMLSALLLGITIAGLVSGLMAGRERPNTASATQEPVVMPPSLETGAAAPSYPATDAQEPDQRYSNNPYRSFVPGSIERDEHGYFHYPPLVRAPEKAVFSSQFRHEMPPTARMASVAEASPNSLERLTPMPLHRRTRTQEEVYF